MTLPSTLATNDISTKKSLAAIKKQKKKASRRYLAKSYEPYQLDVLIGRGRRVDNHPGNLRFRALVQSHLKAYYNAQTKATKTTIILRIFQDVKRTAQANGAGSGFIKQECPSKRWFVVEDSAARISIAQAFRDALSMEYKSSRQYKQLKRREQERLEMPETDSIFMAQQGGDYPKVAMSSSPTSVMADAINVNMNMLPPPPLLPPQVSSDGHDLTRMSCRVLDTAEVPHVVTASNNNEDEEPTAAGDLFLSLYSAFGPGNDNSSDDPFEPIPIAEAAMEPSSQPASKEWVSDGASLTSLMGRRMSMNYKNMHTLREADLTLSALF